VVQLLSQYGFSDNVYDKDGQTPLDFQERVVSEELQEVIRINKLRLFESGVVEPNPWSWKVWTRIQSEKDTLKQLISYSNPIVALNIKRGHSHNHGHGHSHHGHSHQGNHSHNCNDDVDDVEDNIANENECHIL
jgi:hypothetical protein